MGIKDVPAWEDIPQEFKNGNTKWNRLFNDWFFFGIEDLKLCPKSGVDADKAMRMIRACMGSWGPKHEHKEAGVAYMFSEFFDDISYKRRKRD